MDGYMHPLPCYCDNKRLLPLISIRTLVKPSGYIKIAVGLRNGLSVEICLIGMNRLFSEEDLIRINLQVPPPLPPLRFLRTVNFLLYKEVVLYLPPPRAFIFLKDRWQWSKVINRDEISSFQSVRGAKIWSLVNRNNLLICKVVRSHPIQ
jgi:hypothetical protein